MPIELFTAYSHRDEALRDDLERHLSMLRRTGVIEVWHDRRIGAGKEWQGEIDERLKRSQVLLLLISSDFLASDYCYDVELKHALDRHTRGEARVIPVILRACDWEHAPLKDLQALPTDARPVTSWPNQDEAMADIARGIRLAVEELTGEASAAVAPADATTATPIAGQSTGLEDWCASSLRRFQELLRDRLPDETPSRYARGTWRVCYCLEPPLAEPLGLSEFLGALMEIRGRETGWPPWWVPSRREIAPYPYEGAIECWLGDREAGPDDSDFWRASPAGKMFLLRGYEDDGPNSKGTPGATFESTLVLWRVGECFLHAARLLSSLGEPDTKVRFRVTWHGLQGRKLVSWANGRHYLSGHEDLVARQPEASSELVFGADEAADLSALVERATKPLYEAFGFYRPDRDLIRDEMRRLTDKTAR